MTDPGIGAVTGQNPAWRFPRRASFAGAAIAAFGLAEYLEFTTAFLRALGFFLAMAGVVVCVNNLEEARKHRVGWLADSYIGWALLNLLAAFFLLTIRGLTRSYLMDISILAPLWILFGSWFAWHAYRIANLLPQPEGSETPESRSRPLRSLTFAILIILAWMALLPSLKLSPLERLMKTAENGRNDLFASCLERVSEEIPEQALEIALCTASENHHVELVQWLLTRKPKLNQPTSVGAPPLWYCLKGNPSLEIAELLLREGASPNLPLAGFDGEKPLGMVLGMSYPIEQKLALIRMLASYGADLNSPVNARGYFPIELAITAVRDNTNDVIGELIRLGSKPLATKGNNLFFRALTTRNPEVLGYLMTSAGLSHTATDARGNTFLHLLVMRQDLESMGQLHNIYKPYIPDVIHTPNVEGKTPLHIAVDRNSPKDVKLLLDWGANPDVPDKQGVTPRELARKSRFLRILDLIDKARPAGK